jgi:cysteine synthase A
MQADSVYQDVLELIGNTPVLSLKLQKKMGVDAEIIVKLENLNPTGSLKDRVYKEMISAAITEGKLKPGMEIVEASTGNAGLSCTFVGKRFGFDVTVVMPEGMSEERKQLIKGFGGKLILTPGGESDVDLSIELAKSMAQKQPEKYWFADQFSNEHCYLAHYKTTAPEIWQQTQGELDCFVTAQGTGGTITGVGRFLREKNPGIKLYTVEPAEAPIISEGRWGTHKIEGIGDGLVPKNLDLSILDGVVTVSSDDAITMTRKLLEEEGIFCGISSGANVLAAIKLAKKHPELKRIVTIINDSGNRYLSTEVFGHKKEVKVPKREHKLDSYTLEQLQKYQAKLEIVR